MARTGIGSGRFLSVAFTRPVIENGRKPALAFLKAHALTRGIIHDLIALDPSDAEIFSLRMTEIQPADGSPRPHGKTFGELYTRPFLGVEKIEQRSLLRVIPLRRIASRRAHALILLRYQLLVG